jgi:hypothetical protein
VSENDQVCEIPRASFGGAVLVGAVVLAGAVVLVGEAVHAGHAGEAVLVDEAEKRYAEEILSDVEEILSDAVHVPLAFVVLESVT